MTQSKEIYKSKTSDVLIEVINGGEGVLVCCDQAMDIMIENSVDAAREKHIPIIERIEGGVLIKVGEVEHPMKEEHHITMIEAHTPTKLYRKYLKPGEKPQAVFHTDEEVVYAREYCNIHGLWKSE